MIVKQPLISGRRTNGIPSAGIYTPTDTQYHAETFASDYFNNFLSAASQLSSMLI